MIFDRDLRSRFISEMTQDRAIVTMEVEYYSTSNNSKTVQDRVIVTMGTNRKSYMVYRTAPFSMTLNTP